MGLIAALDGDLSAALPTGAESECPGLPAYMVPVGNHETASSRSAGQQRLRGHAVVGHKLIEFAPQSGSCLVALHMEPRPG